MITLVIFLNLFVFVFNILILARVISSFIFPNPDQNFATRWLFDVTEPVLAPVRKLLPSTGLLDLSPLVTFFLLQGLQVLANSLISTT